MFSGLQSPTPPQYVFWYHNNDMINYDTSRGGIDVQTQTGPRTQSRLTIRNTNDGDSGNYTCSASNTEPASIYVFVSEGKQLIILRFLHRDDISTLANFHKIDYDSLDIRKKYHL